MLDGMQPGEKASRRGWGGTAWSMAIHALVLVACVGAMHRVVRIVPNRFPGTSEGVEFLTYYSPGSTKLTQSDIQAKAVEKEKTASVTHTAKAMPTPDPVTAASTERGVGSSGESGLGDGNIVIALPKYFPHPAPSLTTLAKGAAGDVILHAVIDEHGRIAELTLMQGLGPAIDDAVIQTVNQWSFVPATKNGVPVASVQELHFHYERKSG
jgi:periplasmic protein TonB